MNETAKPVKVLIYLTNRAKKFIGPDKPQPNLSRFANQAFLEYLEKLESLEASKK